MADLASGSGVRGQSSGADNGSPGRPTGQRSARIHCGDGAALQENMRASGSGHDAQAQRAARDRDVKRGCAERVGCPSPIGLTERHRTGAVPWSQPTNPREVL